MAKDAQHALPGPDVLIKEAWKIYKKQFGTLFGIILIPGLLSGIFVALFVMFGIATTVSLTFGHVNPATLIGPGAIGLLVAVLLLTIVQSWSQAALIIAIHDHEKSARIGEILKKAWSKIGQYWQVTLLTFIVSIGGLFLFVIPGLIFGIWFSFAIFVAVLENERGMDALMKSKKYVEGRWWDTLARLVVPGVISFLISIAVSILFGFNPDTHTSSSTLSSLISFLLTPLFAAYYYLLYTHLKKSAGEIDMKEARKGSAGYIIVGVIGILIAIAMTGLIITAAATAIPAIFSSPSPTPSVIASPAANT